VGDAEFQKKCLGKMKDVSTGEGRTVLFVSHNMAAVKSLCKGGVVLENGAVKYTGNSIEAVTVYLKGDAESQNLKLFDKQYDNADFKLKEISLNPKGKTSDFVLDEHQEIEINIKIDIKNNAERRHITFVLNNEEGEPLFTFSHVTAGLRLKNGFNHLICSLPKGFLNIGSYFLSLYIIQDSRESIFIEKDIISFDIQEGERGVGKWMGKEPGFIKPNFQWVNHTELETKS
jgi:lipopolysaccharide transport system ATP-binding protein